MSFRLLKEDSDKYHVVHPNGEHLQVHKSGLSDKAHKFIKGLPAFADGGEIHDYSDPEDLAPSPTQEAAPTEIPAPEPEVDAPVASPAIPQSPIDAEKSAISQIAKNVGAQSAAEQQAYKNTEEQIASLPTQEEIVQRYATKDAELQKAFAEKKIDPDRYWHDMGTGSKIAAGVGLFLGGIGQAFGGGPNAALGIIHNAINRDIEAQKSAKEGVMTQWKMNRQALGDDLSANLATQNQHYNALKIKLAEAASQFKGPQAIAQAQLANAMIDKQIMQNNQLLGLNAELQGKAGTGSEDSFQQALQTASTVSPQMAKEAQSRYIPGVGIASKPVPEKVHEELVSLSNIRKALDEATVFQKTVAGRGGVWTPQNKAKAESLKLGLAADLNKLYKLNRLTEIEYENFTKQIGDIGGVNLGGSQIERLNSLMRQLNDTEKATLQGYGVKPFKKAPADSVAIQWARQNPNDPRAVKIMQQNGVK